MTVSYDLAEGIAQAMVDYIESAQTVKLAAVDARYTTALSLADFTVRFGDVYQRREALDVYPILYVSPLRARLDATVGGLTRSAMVEHSFTFIILAYQPDAGGETPTETLKRSLMRYSVAVLEMLIESHNGTTRPWEWGTGAPTEVQYRSFPGENAYFGLASIQINCQYMEVA